MLRLASASAGRQLCVTALDLNAQEAFRRGYLAIMTRASQLGPLAGGLLAGSRR